MDSMPAPSSAVRASSASKSLMNVRMGTRESSVMWFSSVDELYGAGVRLWNHPSRDCCCNHAALLSQEGSRSIPIDSHLFTSGAVVENPDSCKGLQPAGSRH